MNEIKNYVEYKCETCFSDMKRLRFNEFYCINCNNGIDKKASFINLPNHNRHIGFWLSNKFIYPSGKHSEQVAIGLIYDNFYPIVKYDENL